MRNLHSSEENISYPEAECLKASKPVGGAGRVRACIRVKEFGLGSVPSVLIESNQFACHLDYYNL